MKKQTYIFSIRMRLIITFAIILLIPLLVLGQISYQTAKSKISDHMTMSSFESVKLLDKLLSTTLVSSMNNVDNLSKNINSTLYNGMESPLVRSYIDPFQTSHPEIASTYLGTQSGLTFIAPYEKVADDYDPRTRPWYQDAMKRKGEVYITEPYLQMNNQTNKPTGNVIVSIVKATEDGSGVVGVDLNLSWIAESVKEVRIGKEGYAVIMDRKGTVLVHPTAEVGSEIKESWVQNVLGVESGEIDATYEGKEKTVELVTNSMTGWKLLGIIDKEEIESEASVINKTVQVVTLISIVVGGILVYFIVRSIISPLSRLVTASERISEGDLTYQITLKQRDEIGALAQSFNRMSEELRRIILEVRQKSEMVSVSSEELTASTEQTKQASNHIAYAMQEVAAGSESQVLNINMSSEVINEMTLSMQQIDKNTGEMSKTAIQATENSLEGGQIIEKAVGQMNNISSTVNQLSEVVQELGEGSQRIGEIIEVITRIADQTNLLALNAAIEAARAGEQGRGFAVVADEVRKLAEQSAGSSQQISLIIRMIQEKTSQAVNSMKEVTNEVYQGISIVHSAGDSFEEIKHSINEVSNQIEHVTSVIHQMSTGSKQVLQSIDVIYKAVEETSAETQNVSSAVEEQLASMEEIAASASSLSDMAEELQKLMGRFKV